MSRARDFADLAGSADAGGITGKNLITNGAMQVAQRGTSKTSTTDGYHTVDRWKTDIGTAFDQLALTTAQDTNAPDGFGNSFKLTVATAETAVASDELLRIWQVVEAQNLQSLAYGTSSAKKTTLSFYVKGSVTGTYALVIYNDDGVRINGSTYTINSANTWERKSITFDGDTSAAINNDNGRGFYIWWILAAGSNYTGTSNAGWQAYSAAAQVADGHTANNFVTTSSATWQITGCQLEVGEQATPFEHRSFGDELLRCQRYFTIVCGNDDNTFTNTHAWTSQEVIGHLGFGKVEMRTNPTISKSDNTHFQIRSGGISETSDNVSFVQSNKLGHCRAEFSGSGGLTAGRGAWVKLNTTSGYIHADAEL
jgi:hypothetical protein